MAMRRALRTIALLALVAAPACALASGGAKVYVTNCTHADFKPRTIIMACGDGGAFVENMSWSKWTATGASGNGKYGYMTCNPNCVAGGIKTVAAHVALSNPKSCPKTKKGKVFTEIAVTFTGKRPPQEPKTLKDNLGCPY
jgi:hypothetical protein